MRCGSPPAIAVVCLVVAGPAAAERLPIRTYTTAEGLPHNAVNRIVRDSRGFLWFATNDGLARFDGYGFVSYSVEQGLPHRTVTDLLETKDGQYWVATFGGLVRFRPDGLPADRRAPGNAGQVPPMFTAFVPAGDPDVRTRAVIALLESRDGGIWCGTRNGLFRLDRGGGRFELRRVEIGIPNDHPEGKYVNDLLEDRHGTLWAGTPRGLYRRWRDGRVARYGVRDGLPDEHIHDLMEDDRGRLWVASRYAGVFQLGGDPGASAPSVVEHYGYPHPLVSTWVNRLLETSDRRFWLTTSLGLMEFLTGDVRGESRFVAYARSNGLSHQEVTQLAEDAAGNLWIGTATSGAMKLARNGFTTFGQQDGLAAGYGLFEDATGQLYVHASTFTAPPERPGVKLAMGGEHVIQRFGRLEGRRFEWFSPAKPFWWGWVPERAEVQTRRGEWWVSGALGLYRYPASPGLDALKTAEPLRIYTRRDGLPAEQVYALYADSRDDVWFSIISPENGLFRWDHATDTLHNLAATPGFPPLHDELPRSFGEDANGHVWIGTHNGVARYRNHAFTFFSAAHGLPPGAIVGIHADSAGRLWLASSRGGLIRVDDPQGDRPVFAGYTMADGLSGNSIEAITSDLHGRIYVATGRGIDQLDPLTGRVKHFSIEDGLAPGTVLTAFRGRTGALWFGTQNGLSRFEPAAPAPSAPPAAMITGVTVAGEPRPVSAVGETEVRLPDLRPGGNQLQIDFVALRFRPGERLHYQYRLDGADHDWAPPAARRSVSYANLSPGTYRFLVRAVNADGVSSPTPAAVAFTVLPPFWQRGWFLSGTALAIAAAVWMLHRYRVSRLLELERVRTRIATDLHDDIGANLTRIAILSEVARQHPHHGAERLDAPLASIATIARESVTSMDDIVWAISPDRDTLQEVVSRMRHHAEEVFEARDVALALDLPDDAQPLRLGVDARRDLYLIFKEAVNNAARHSGCTRVSIAFRVTGSRLVLEIADDGRGFDAAGEGDGHGLMSMRRRAARLGASLEVRGGAGHGTTVRLTMPVAGARPSVALPG